MKWLVLCVFLFFFTISQGQTAPPGTNKVQVISSLSDSLLFNNAVRFLVNQGWSIDKADSKQQTLTTDYMDLHHEKELDEAWRIRLLVTVQNSIITFRSLLYAHSLGRVLENEPVVLKGLDDDVHRTAFRRMAEVARQFSKDVPDGEIRYRTQ